MQCTINQSAALDTVMILRAMYLKDKAIWECPIVSIRTHKSAVKITRTRNVI